MNIIGISAFYHDAACCLIQNGRLLAAASEERFSRVKYDPRLPVQAFRFCLEEAGLDIVDIDAVAYYEYPTLKLGRQLWCGKPADADQDLAWLDPHRAHRAIREKLGFEGLLLCFEHHQSHAASSFYFSGFPEAAILTVDGVGEWATTSYGKGAGDSIELFEEIQFPHSLGLLYATITAYLGFKVNDGEYKVMGLAPYGQPKYADHIRRLIASESDGGFRLDMRYFDFVSGTRMYSSALCDLLGAPPRKREASLTRFHMDVACSLQTVLEEILLEKVAYLHQRAPSANLCMAGGVALNCTANGRILREGPFDRLFVQPAAGDAGGCLGAAALAHLELAGERVSSEPMRHVFYGPAWSSDKISDLIAATGVQACDFRDNQTGLFDRVVDLLAENKVIGWFQDAMEFGPRALGARSILANPMDPATRDRLNQMVKKRESFRPFAPSVLAIHAGEHFDLDHASPYMLEICRVISKLSLPGVTHVNDSARPQTVDAETCPRYAALIEAFYRKTGCPILVNTSFNVRGEPIVCSPVDALFCMSNAGLDALVLGDFMIERDQLPDHWQTLLSSWRSRSRGPFSRRGSAISENLYTFV